MLVFALNRARFLLFFPFFVSFSRAFSLVSQMLSCCLLLLLLGVVSAQTPPNCDKVNRPGICCPEGAWDLYPSYTDRLAGDGVCDTVNLIPGCYDGGDWYVNCDGLPFSFVCFLFFCSFFLV